MHLSLVSQKTSKECLLDTAFEDDHGDFDPEGMLSLNDSVNFDTAFQSFFGEFLDFDVDFIHSWIPNVGFCLADTTYKTDHGSTAVIAAQSLVEGPLNQRGFEGAHLEEAFREVQGEVMVGVPRKNNSWMFELLLTRSGETKYHDQMFCQRDEGVGNGALFQMCTDGSSSELNFENECC